MVDRTALQNLTRFDRLINIEDGTPTDLFMRILQGKNNLASDTATVAAGAAATANALADIVIDTTAPIAGGPLDFGSHVIGDPNYTLSHDDSGVTPGTYGDSTHAAVVTVDAKGHVTSASQVAIPGAGTAYRPMVTGAIPAVFLQEPDGSLIMEAFTP